MTESARAYEERRRGERTSGSTAFPRRNTIDSDDDLPPIDERPTQITPQAPRISQPIGQVPTRTPAPRDRNVQQPPRISQPIGQVPTRTPAPRDRNVQQPPVGSRSTASAQPISQRPAVAPRPRPAASRTGTRPPNRMMQRPPRHNRGLYTIGIILILIILLLGLLAYLVPSADVTITLPSRDYTQTLRLNIVSHGNGANGSGTVIADTFTQEFTKSGNGTATGATKIGTAPASGTVTFTNNGTYPTTIPAGIVVTTSDGKQQFTTIAEAVVPPKGDKLGNTIPIPVQALQSGPAGNVGTGAINTIPDDSLSKIAQASHLTTADIQLQVLNNEATQGGGAGNAAMITEKDRNDISASLQSALQESINSWVQHKKTAQDDVESTPSQEPQLVNTPATGQVIPNGNTFSAQLKVTVTVIVVHAIDLKAATASTLNDLLHKDKTYAGYIINQDAPPSLTMQELNFSKATKTPTLSFKATAKAIPDIDVAKIQRLIAGKSVNEASTAIKGIQHVQGVEIKTSPGFIWWVSSWPTHIAVHLLPTTAPVQPKK